MESLRCLQLIHFCKDFQETCLKRIDSFEPFCIITNTKLVRNGTRRTRLYSEKLFKTKKNEMIRKTVTNLVAVRLKNLSHEFDVIENYLRYIASTSEHLFTAIKRHFNKCARKLLKEAIDSKSNSETATVVLQEGFSGICLLKASSIILKLKLKFPKKKDRTDISKLCDKKERMTQWLEISILMN
ncbi:BFH_HP2_G0005180.mRNA.1.CDS.1 [Saccharomyces cerevisiae]|nr:BFH_HP2_G0005180.mRNA.1.CDS.1 [Saccharomyces cerevisiae]CAI6406023.1 BFH_HP2_G0005180.mRNA.1.CDS.1 [Saccharomyces cerevisiae]